MSGFKVQNIYVIFYFFLNCWYLGNLNYKPHNNLRVSRRVWMLFIYLFEKKTTFTAILMIFFFRRMYINALNINILNKEPFQKKKNIHLKKTINKECKIMLNPKKMTS